MNASKVAFRAIRLADAASFASLAFFCSGVSSGGNFLGGLLSPATLCLPTLVEADDDDASVAACREELNQRAERFNP